MAAEAGAQQAAAVRKEAKSLRLQLAERETCMAAAAAELAMLLADTALGVSTSGRASQEGLSALSAGQQGSNAALSAPQRRKRLDAICRRLASYGHPPEGLEPSVQDEVQQTYITLSSLKQRRFSTIIVSSADEVSWRGVPTWVVAPCKCRAIHGVASTLYSKCTTTAVAVHSEFSCVQQDVHCSGCCTVGVIMSKQDVHCSGCSTLADLTRDLLFGVGEVLYFVISVLERAGGNG